MKNIEQYGVIPHAGDPVDRLRVTREVDPAAILLGFDQHFFVEMLEQYQQVVKPDLKIFRTRMYYRELFSSSKFRSVLEDDRACFILIDKPTGEASLETVSRLRTHTDIKRIGFAGTLDPLASGLLICGISKATSILDWFHFFPKTYEAEMKLGSISDSYDTKGVIKIHSQNEPSRNEVLEAFESKERVCRSRRCFQRKKSKVGNCMSLLAKARLLTGKKGKLRSMSLICQSMSIRSFVFR
jgi:hypothetical protein